ncbi:MAG TPA: SRPBCC family protein [Nitrosopumilaceae archaeon]|nr:SRPBCC family protein [Nitrosopumilaceae archaeon]
MATQFLNGTVTRSVVVHVSPQKAWRRLSEIGNLARWIVGIKKCVITSKKRKGVGATRLITFNDGSVIEEQIVIWNSGKSFSYLVIGKILPFRAYFATLSIKPLGRNLTKVTWSGYIGTNNVTKAQFKKTISKYDLLYKSSLPRLKSLMEQ